MMGQTLRLFSLTAWIGFSHRVFCFELLCIQNGLDERFVAVCHLVVGFRDLSHVGDERLEVLREFRIRVADMEPVSDLDDG